jgi:hypothetical protein
MQCPVDGADLLITERQGIEIDYCPKCRGVWLDRGELDKLIERSLQVERGSYQPPAPTQDEYAKQKRGDYPPPAAQPPLAEDRRRFDDDDYYDDDRRRYDTDPRRHDEDPQRRKKRGFLGELFDIFD